MKHDKKDMQTEGFTSNDTSVDLKDLTLFDFDPYLDLKFNTMMKKMGYFHGPPLIINAKHLVEGLKPNKVSNLFRLGYEPPKELRLASQQVT